VAVPLPDLAKELEERLERMGFELVDAEWVGRASRPILRIRMDLPDSVPGEGGVTVDQCAEVSRAVEPWLDEHPGIPGRYVLEVSSPGVDRPLKRPRDWERFAGQPVLVKGKRPPGGKGDRLEGEILGLERDEDERERAALLLPSGEKLRIPLDEIEEAHLVYRWN
jgi:ribosome maturation factor RimP